MTLRLKMSQPLPLAMLDDDHAHAIELQEDNEEILCGEEHVRLRDDLVMNDQAETQAEERTVLQQNGTGKSLNCKGMLDGRTIEWMRVPIVPFPRTAGS